MVRITVLGCVFATLLSATSGSCHKHARIEIKPYDHAGCSADTSRDQITLKEGKCENVDDFQSFEAFPYKADKYPFHSKECVITAFTDQGCRGFNSSQYVEDGKGLCVNAKFEHVKGHAPAQGRSFLVACDPPVSEKSKSKSKSASGTPVQFSILTVSNQGAASIATTTVTQKVVSSTPSTTPLQTSTIVKAVAPSNSSTIPFATSTVVQVFVKSTASISSVHPTQHINLASKSSVSSSSSSHECCTHITTMTTGAASTHTTTKSTGTPSPKTKIAALSSSESVTIKSTTTILKADAATVTGLTTVWVAPSSLSSITHHMATYTHTVTVDKAKELQARQTGAQRRSASLKDTEHSTSWTKRIHGQQAHPTLVDMSDARLQAANLDGVVNEVVYVVADGDVEMAMSDDDVKRDVSDVETGVVDGSEA